MKCWKKTSNFSICGSIEPSLHVLPTEKVKSTIKPSIKQFNCIKLNNQIPIKRLSKPGQGTYSRLFEEQFMHFGAAFLLEHKSTCNGRSAFKSIKKIYESESESNPNN